MLTLTPLYEDGVRPAFVLVTATLVTDALARATRLHERLRGMVGHDLRNPLSSVMTAASLLLRRGGLPPAQESAARRIESAAQRMARMICHILELSRAALDEETVATRAPSDLAAIVKSAVVEYEGRVDVVFEEGAVASESGPPGDAWQGEWDCELLRDALASIVRNAVEHARPDTRARLTLRATSAPSGLHEHERERERDDRASAFEIVIDNEGAPIALANAARVVDPHDLGDHGKRPGHLGLGLFVAARAIVAHGGNVTLTARGEDGTRVRVVLPRRPYVTSG